MSKVTRITDSDFDTTVIKPKKPALVFFSAVWNGASSVVRPIVDQASEEYDGLLNFYNIDIDNGNETASKYNVKGVPTFIIFKNGQVTGQAAGITIKQRLKELIDKS